MAYRERSKEFFEFIEELKIPSGVGQGEPFRLRPWQKRFIDKVYGPETKKGKRVVSQAILSVARKNGKTSLIAALVLAHLCGPGQEYNGEIYSAANEREQAGIVFRIVCQIIRMDSELEAMLRIIESTKTIVNYENGTVYRAISAEAGTKHGLNPSVVIYDELGQAKNRDLYDALDTAMGAREEPLFFIISTQNPDPQHILSQLIDDGLSKKDPSIVADVYAVPDDEENIFNQKVWKKANPALGDFRLLRDFKKHADRAKRMPSFESTFRNLYLNQRIDAETPLISRVEWVGCKDEQTKIEPGERIYLGLDLSATTDLCALVGVSADNGDRVAGWFWKPGDLIDEHERRDRAPYRLWANQGLIDAPPGRAIDYGYVAATLAQINADFEILGLAYDRWRVEILFKELTAIGVDCFVDGKEQERPGALRLVPWGQGFKDISPAIDALEMAVINGELKHNGNPVLTWNMANAIAVTDPAGNRKLDKSKSRFRIDGAVALTMGMGLKARLTESVEEESYTLKHGVVVL